MMNTPLVSICCITFNHANYIRNALDGFLMQEPPSCMPQDAKLSDWCEILIHDDCSTDGTDIIIREYAETYQGLFYPLYEEENQFSRGMAGHMDSFNITRAKGKYIAICEGDDYWTDPLKLQKQIDILEADETLVACFTDCMVVDLSGNVLEKKRQTIKRENEGRYGLREFLEDNRTAPLSLVYRFNHREELLQNLERLRSKYLGDWQLYVCLLIHGDMYYLNEVTCAYRVNPSSVTNVLWPKERVGRIMSDRRIYRELAKILPPEYADIAADFRDIRWTWVPLMFAYKAEKRYWGMIGCFIVSCFVCPGRLWRAFKEGLQKRL